MRSQAVLISFHTSARLPFCLLRISSRSQRSENDKLHLADGCMTKPPSLAREFFWWLEFMESDVGVEWFLASRGAEARQTEQYANWRICCKDWISFALGQSETSPPTWVVCLRRLSARNSRKYEFFYCNCMFYNLIELSSSPSSVRLNFYGLTKFSFFSADTEA